MRRFIAAGGLYPDVEREVFVKPHAYLVVLGSKIFAYAYQCVSYGHLVGVNNTVILCSSQDVFGHVEKSLARLEHKCTARLNAFRRIGNVQDHIAVGHIFLGGGVCASHGHLVSRRIALAGEADSPFAGHGIDVYGETLRQLGSEPAYCHGHRPTGAVAGKFHAFYCHLLAV